MNICLISTSTYPGDQGLRTVSSCLKREGHKVNMLFLPLAEDYSKKYSGKEIYNIKEFCKGFELIGVSSMVSTSIRAAQLIEELKKTKVPVVWGGVHATICPDECIKIADYVCRGEAEFAMVEFANFLEKGKDVSKVKNFWVRKNGKVYKNEVRPLVENLDILAPPDYDIQDHYILKGGKVAQFEESDLNGQIFFQTVRGCPNQCTYCSNRFIRSLYSGKGKNLRAHSVDYIINCLVDWKNRFKSLGTLDLRAETFFVRPLSEIKDFSRKYKAKVGIRFKCLADPPTMNEEKLKALIEAGLTDIIIGIQSGSNKVNYEIYKRYIKSSKVLEAAAIVNKYKDKLAVMYDIITTNPYEEPEDVIATIRLLQKIPKPYYLSVNNLVFFWGTELYTTAINDGLIKTERDSAFNLNYWDRFKHIKLKKKNAYLNLILNLMRGPATEKRFGIMPNFLLNTLLKESWVKFNLKHTFPTYFVGYLLQVFDFWREKIAKPVYRKFTPSSFKVWYDKVRYRV